MASILGLRLRVFQGMKNFDVCFIVSVKEWIQNPSKFKIRSNLQFLVPQGRRDASITVKFGMEEHITLSLSCATFHTDQ